MIKRRCCCGGTEPGGIACPQCPSPVSPCVCPQYEIDRFFVDVTADSGGSGQIYPPVVRQKGCMRGSCGRQRYRRKHVTPSNGVGEDCAPDSYTDCVCQNLVDLDSPSCGGDFYWRGCVCGCEVAGCPDEVLEYEGAVDLDEFWLFPQMKWVPAVCNWQSQLVDPDGDCRSVLKFNFSYNDSYSQYKSIRCLDDECIVTSTYTITVNQTWECWYSRRIQAGQFMATGSYRLVKCTYPATIETLNDATSNGQPLCGIPGGTVCSADGISTVGKIPTIWQPPNSITVRRIC